jgi:hypothetical protein
VRRLTLPLLLLAAGCRDTHTFQTLNIEDVRSDGATVTSIVTHEEIMASQAFYEHGSRYEQVTRLTGAIQWTLPSPPQEGALMAPARIARLALERAEASDHRGAGLAPVAWTPIVFRDHVFHIDYERGLMDRRRLDEPGSRVGATLSFARPAGREDALVFSSSGRHVLAFLGAAPAVVIDTQGPSAARELGDTPGLRDMRRRLGNSDFWTRVLTDDGRYWIEVPHNAGRGPGNNHCKAVFLDLERDAADEVTFDFGEGNHEIVDAESVQGELIFLVAYGGRLAVSGAKGDVRAWVPDDGEGYTPGSRHHWDAAGRRLVSWTVGDLSSWGPLRIADHDYARGVTVRYTLELGDAMTRLGAR